MSDSETNMEEIALARLRVALTRADIDPEEVDDDVLLALTHAELPPETEASVLEQLSASASLRAYLIELSRPVDDERAARALALMGIPPTESIVVRDILEPELPGGLVIRGPFGRIRTTMDSRIDSDAPPRFGPHSEIEWQIHAETDTELPSPITLWRRQADSDYVQIMTSRVERTDEAMRITVAASDVFPAPGVWTIALLAGPADHPADATVGASAHLSETVVRFDAAPSDEPL